MDKVWDVYLEHGEYLTPLLIRSGPWVGGLFNMA